MRVHLGLSARDTRTLMSGACVIVALFAAARGVPAALLWQRDRVVEATALTRQSKEAHAGARNLPMLRDSLHDRADRLARLNTVLLSGESAAAAAANLASLLEDLADSSSIKVSAMGLRADSAAAGSLVPVAVRLTGTTDVAGLASFLRVVESGDTPMLVRELAVTQPDPIAAPSKVEQLWVDVLVETMARVAAARAPLVRKWP